MKRSFFGGALSKAEQRVLEGLTSPPKIQEFLDRTSYSTENIYRCPLRVLRERRAHCFDGAVFAAAALRALGLPPLVLELIPNERDDDHLIALYKRQGLWGAVAKSNFVGLRFREPVFRNLRELVLSYFEQFFNSAGEKTLRAYTLPLDLTRFDTLRWTERDEPMDRIAGALDRKRRVSLLTDEAVRHLSLTDERSRRAGLLGADEAGLFRPGPVAISKKKINF
ncbi:MAG: hypothetical protein MUC98_12600 [Desulfobacterota bacterium]|nr:hypothetical protein [Thermodesulfobacteriota bacterium]